MDYINGFNFGKGVKADIYCRSRDTRNGFAHDCTIPALGIKATCGYINRTWESFNFESVIHEAFDKYVQATYKCKRCSKEFDREYDRLCKRLTAWHSKGKIQFRRDPSEIFG